MILQQRINIDLSIVQNVIPSVKAVHFIINRIHDGTPAFWIHFLHTRLGGDIMNIALVSALMYSIGFTYNIYKLVAIILSVLVSLITQAAMV